MSDSDASAHGWDAIDAALSRVYGDAKPHTHWGTVLRWSLGGPDPLDGISVYKREDPVPHWHYVSYGLSELYSKQTTDPELSGYGFELTARLRRADDQPPIFMAHVLQNLARYVFETGNRLKPGDSMDLFGPILEGSDTAIRAAMFYQDPELEPAHSVFGHVSFVQVLGVRLEERAAIRTWDAKAVEPLLEELLPALVTDLERPSLLGDERFTAAIEAGRNRDGSSMAGLATDEFVPERARRFPKRPASISIPATIVDTLALVLPLRLPFGRSFRIDAGDSSLTITPGTEWELRPDRAPHWELSLTNDQVHELAATLRPVAGHYEFISMPNFRVTVTRTTIRDQQGNVIDHVG